MTDQATDTPPIDDNFLAAELVLGLAEGDDLIRAQDRMLRDRDFAMQVAGWQERFVAMTDDIAPVKPRKRLKSAINAAVFPKRLVPLGERLWVWRGLTLASVCLAAYVAIPQLRPPPAEGPSRVLATQLTSQTSALQVLAVLDADAGTIALRRLAGVAPTGRVLELWAILPEQAPISLGVLPETEAARVALPSALAAQAAVLTLAISEEPQGGAPEGAPTGEILAVGAVSEI